MNWVCYLLRCSDDTLYCGITNDLDKRIKAHNSGIASKYTRMRIPVELVFTEYCADRSTASKREIQIKSLPRTEKLVLIQPTCCIPGENEWVDNFKTRKKP